MTDQSSGSLSDYLAAERTFLAWIRTGLALMGFGFVVARFGLFLQALRTGQPNLHLRPNSHSFWFGTALIVLGVIVNIVAAWNHIRLVRELKRGESTFARPSSLAISVAVMAESGSHTIPRATCRRGTACRRSWFRILRWWKRWRQKPPSERILKETMNRLKDKRALITGGTSGIGLETARQFLSEGARVAITGRNPATLESAREALGAGVLIIPSDAGDVAAQKAAAETIGQAFGGLDILFLNSGVAELRPVGQWDEAAFDRSFAINVKGPYFLVQALLPIFANPASIVLNTSVNIHIGMPNSSVYAATKAALLSFARTISGELISRGIRVNAVSPGPISTPLYGKFGIPEADLKAVSASILNLVPAGRFGNASEVAQAVVFLASDEASFTVGSELQIDGGMGTL